MAQTVPTLNLRVGAPAALTAAQHDENMTILKDFMDALAAQLGASLKIDGTLNDNAVLTAAITDRNVTQSKLAFTAMPFYEDTSVSGGIIAIAPSPACTAFEKGMVFIIRLPEGKESNAGGVKLEVNDLNGDDAADVIKSGGGALDSGSIQGDSILLLTCTQASAPPEFMVLANVTSASTGII